MSDHHMQPARQKKYPWDNARPANIYNLFGYLFSSGQVRV